MLQPEKILDKSDNQMMIRSSGGSYFWKLWSIPHHVEPIIMP